MSKRLEGKVAVVTGAGQGVGRAYAHALSAEGASVIVNDLARPGQDSTAEAVAAEIVQAGGKAAANHESVTDFDGAARMMASAVASFGRLDILIANAGIIRPANLHEAAESEWADVMAVHANGTFNCIRHAAPLMIEQDGGSIITTGDITTDLFYPRIAAYRAAKAAIVVLTKYAAAELGEFNINANAVMPGATATTMAATFFGSLDDKLDSFLGDVKSRDELPEDAHLDEPAPPETVPPIGVFLCTDEGREITGRSFQMNGTDVGVVATSSEITYLHTDNERWTTDELAAKVPGWLGEVPSTLA
jgi:NAD(P)-dependent dehydrogenase (short-subunit alcohol dehydrogenase family)